jgi:hypothetical protein
MPRNQGLGLGSGARIERIRVVGMDELRKELRQLEQPKTWMRELTATHKIIARDVAGKARSAADGMGGPYRHFSRAIRGYGSQTSARIGIGSAGRGQRNWGANAAFWGVKDPITGWNKSRVPNQVTEWVGNTWDIATGQGPVAIVDTIVQETPYIINRYGDMIEEITRRAFPD